MTVSIEISIRDEDVERKARRWDIDPKKAAEIIAATVFEEATGSVKVASVYHAAYLYKER